MGDLILRTKLFIPPAQRDLVPRPRLVERMIQSSACKLTLISAPAGFGKSTLVVHWHDSLPVRPPMAWVSLDEGDNDPRRFWTYVLAALQALPAAPGTDALALLQSSPPPPIESVLTLLLNELAAVPGQVTLVLDDYHAIHTPAIHDGVVLLLENLPPQVHVIMTTRADPPLPLSRMRVRGQVAELRAADLRFSDDEVQTFFANSAGIRLTRDQADLLGARTEGWVAGLKLAGLSMQGLSDVTGFIQAFTGSHRHIADYLVEEVLQRLGDDLNTFLMHTSVLDRLTGPLCDALTGRSDGTAMLSRLERTNLFLIPLDQDRRWYRYHHLFQDLLRMRLRFDAPDRPPLLHLKASEWFEANGMPDDAIRHALDGQHLERAAAVLESEASRLLYDRGDSGTLLSWMRSLPPALVRQKPFLCTCCAIALTVAGAWEEAEERIRDAEALLPSLSAHTARTLSARILNCKAMHAFTHGELSKATALIDEGLTLAGPDNPFDAGLMLYLKAAIFHVTGQIREANAAAEETIRLNEAVGNPHVVLYAHGNLTTGLVQAGQLQKAIAVTERALELAGATPLADLPLILRADLHLEQNQLAEAEASLARGLSMAARSGRPDPLRYGYITTAKLRLAQGDKAGALAAAGQALEVARAQRSAYGVASISALQAQIALACGETAKAAAWAREYEASLSQRPPFSTAFPDLALARIWIALGEAERCLPFLRQVAQRAEADGRHGSLIEALMLEALAHEARGNPAMAVGSLTRALTLAEPEGYIHLFAAEGPPLARILVRIPSAYAGRLAQLTGGASEPAPRAVPGLIEPLTERELEVLALLAAGCSNQEIAQRLIVAEGTVKKHTHNIFAKLGVASRTQALVRVTEFGLLDK